MNTPFRTQLQNSIFLIVFPLCYILMGAMFQFVPDINPRVVAIVLATCVVVAGAVMIARYFLQSSFRDLYSYDFSFGAFAVIAGVCMMVAADRIGELLITLLGVFMLMTSIIKVQNAIQLISMKRKTWIPVMVIAVLLIVADVLVIVDPFSDAFVKPYTNFLLMTDGVLSFVINVLMHIHARKRERSMAMSPVGGAYRDPVTEPVSVPTAEPPEQQRRTGAEKKDKKDKKAENVGETERQGDSVRPTHNEQKDARADKSAEEREIAPAKVTQEQPAVEKEKPAADDHIKELFGNRK